MRDLFKNWLAVMATVAAIFIMNFGAVFEAKVWLAYIGVEMSMEVYLVWSIAMSSSILMSLGIGLMGYKRAAFALCLPMFVGVYVILWWAFQIYYGI